MITFVIIHVLCNRKKNRFHDLHFSSYVSFKDKKHRHEFQVGRELCWAFCRSGLGKGCPYRNRGGELPENIPSLEQHPLKLLVDTYVRIW